MQGTSIGALLPILLALVSDSMTALPGLAYKSLQSQLPDLGPSTGTACRKLSRIRRQAHLSADCPSFPSVVAISTAANRVASAVPGCTEVGRLPRLARAVAYRPRAVSQLDLGGFQQPSFFTDLAYRLSTSLQLALPLHFALLPVPHSLRRTARFDSQQLPRARSASVGAPPQPQQQFTGPTTRNTQRPPVNRQPSHARSASASRSDRRDVHPALRISNRTASAILYTLEVGLRSPHQFTPYFEEENASMSDLAGVPGTSRGSNGAAGRATAAGAGQTASPLRTPRDIMRDREAKQRARLQREQEEAAAAAESDRQRRVQDEDMRRTAERRSAGVSAQLRDSGYRSAEAGNVSAGGAASGQPVYNPAFQNQPTSAGAPPSSSRYANPDSATTPRGYGRSENVPTSQLNYPTSAGTRDRAAISRPQDNPKLIPTSQPTAMPTSRPQASAQLTQPTTATRPTPATGPTPVSQQPPSTTQPVIAGPAGESTGRNARDSNVSSFPHAFERWENLSSRWEGLTSYWIRKLESNPQRADINQEMARQITDLAAAGANLFHAVVELQRLRASSERKFQRWFFETRAQQEESQENQARLQRSLDQERKRRVQAEQQLQESVEGVQMNRNVERLLGEYKRELQIAKDEARRAWEDLGKQEQLERERTHDLREGHAIDIGGIQVVPHNAPSRGGSLQQRGATQGPTATAYQQATTPITAIPRGDDRYQYGTGPQGTSPTNTDPFSSGEQQAIISPPSSRGQPNVPARATSRSQESQLIPPLAPQPPVTSVAATPHARGSSQVAPALAAGASPSERFYSREAPVHQQPTQQSYPPTSQPYLTTATPGRVSGSETEEEPEWELDASGHVVTDEAGRPVVARGPSTRSRRRTRRPSNDSDDERERARVSVMRGNGQYSNVPTGQVGYGTAPHSQSQEAEIVREPLGGPTSGDTYDDEPEVYRAAPIAGSAAAAAAADYEGRGFAEDDDEWAEMQQSRHHHPTRLSDVPEEDERSRESRISRPSGGSGGMF
ncbi:MAG: hypothetical protein Q9162_006183 [Coniocarpon cinnabarinum]